MRNIGEMTLEQLVEYIGNIEENEGKILDLSRMSDEELLYNSYRAFPLAEKIDFIENYFRKSLFHVDKLIGYHGTTFTNGTKILKDGEFKIQLKENTSYKPSKYLFFSNYPAYFYGYSIFLGCQTSLQFAVNLLDYDLSYRCHFHLKNNGNLINNIPDFLDITYLENSIFVDSKNLDDIYSFKKTNSLKEMTSLHTIITKKDSPIEYKVSHNVPTDRIERIYIIKNNDLTEFFIKLNDRFFHYKI